MKNLGYFLFFLISIIVIEACNKNQAIDSQVNFDFDWKFAPGDYPDANKVDFDDSDWRQLDVPHDFSIEHPFDSLNPTGTGGGFTFSGIGWYRKHFVLDKNSEGKRVTILFNGVYRNSEVWINGEYLGIRPYGYSSFYYDLTPYLKPAGQENIIAVKVNTSEQPNSRWYTGAGIYRHVWLQITDRVHFDQWGVFVQIIDVNKEKANLKIASEIINDRNTDEQLVVSTRLISREGKIVAGTNSNIAINQADTLRLEQSLEITQPELWSIEKPYLYNLQVEIKSGSAILDSYSTPFGIRTFHFDPDKGFFLNGEHIKLKGVNNHHDGGPLGAACQDYTFERQLKILKEVGCNALRMSHNPPAPELLDAADKMGFVVIDEIFDEWMQGKTKAGYSPHFKEWYERDVANWVRRDRNHSSVIAWSIGNEVVEQWNDSLGNPIIKMLSSVVKKHDKTRPITSGCNGIPQINKNGMGELLDIVGYNYQEALYEVDHQSFPQRVIFATETVMYPYQPGDCGQMHSYENWLTGQLEDYVAGEFIWTGFDYIGEAGIGHGGLGCDPWFEWPGWPWRGAECGLVDICGFEKPAYWFRKALWVDEPMVYIAVETDPSAKNREACSFWGWPEVENHWNYNREGDTLAVHVYTNVPDVELFLNEKSLGKKHWDIKKEAFLVWNVPFQKGKLTAIGTTTDGKEVSFEVKTAGKPAKIKLLPDRQTIRANKQDLSYIKAVISDENDIPVPFADNIIEFEVSGAGFLNSVGNGSQKSHTMYKGNKIEAFKGKCIAIVQSTDLKGDIIVKAKSKNIGEVSIKLTAN